MTASPALITPQPPTRTVTLDDVLNIALGNNSSIILAQQRVRKAEEQISQVDAQARPQVNASLTDTLSSQRGFGTSAGAITNPSLPGGGVIPTVTDAGGGNNASFVGGGGGGTTSSTGTIGITTGTGTTSLGTGATNIGTGASGFGSGTTGTTGTGTTGTGTGGTTNGIGTGTTGTGGTTTNGTGTGTSGTTGTGTFGTTGPSAGGTGGTVGTGTSTGALAAPSARRGVAFAVAADLPPVMQHYAASSRKGVQTTPLPPATGKVAPRDTTGVGTGAGTGDGTGTGTTGTTIISGGSSGQYNNYGGRVTVSQYIDIFGLLGTARDVEKITRDFYVLDLQRIANETALSAKNLYFNVLKAQGQLAVDQEQVNFATENVRITQARATAGLAAQFDVLSAQTQLSNAQQQLISAQNSLDLTLQNLNNLLGLRLDQTLSLQTPPLPPLTDRYDTGQSIQTAFTNRPELKQAGNNLVIAQKLIKLAGEDLMPTFGVIANASYNGNTGSGSPHDTYNLSAQLGIPLSDGGLTRSRIRSAQIDLQTQQITQSTLQQTVELEVRQALININDAQAQSASASQGVTQAQEAVRLAQVRYQNGIGTLLDVTNAQANLATARFNLLNAQFGYQTAIAQLVRAEGGR